MEVGANNLSQLQLLDIGPHTGATAVAAEDASQFGSTQAVGQPGLRAVAERSELSGCNATEHPDIIMDSLRRAVASYGLRGRGCPGVGLRLGMHGKVHVPGDQALNANVCSCRARRREHVDL